MRPILLAALVLAAVPARAEHRVLLVVPPAEAAKAGPAVDLETRLAHSPDVTLISRGSQLEIIRGLGAKKDPVVDDALALRLGRLAGADAVVHGLPGAWKLCKLPGEACTPLAGADAAEAAEAALRETGAAPPPARTGPWPDETASAAALTHYAACRAAVSVAAEQAAVKLRKTSTKGLDADCRKAAAADPAYLPAKAALAAARALQGDPKAEADLRAALEALPADPIPAAALVYLLVSKDRHQEALDVLAATEKRATNSLDLLRLHGERLYNMDMFDRALPYFQQALALAPRSPYLHWRVSYTLHMGDKDAEALEHAQKASEYSGGEHPFYQEEYASRLIDNGRYEEALKVLEPLRKADPAWGRIALRTGYALHKLGRSAEAVPLFEAAVRAKPREKRENLDGVMAEIDLARAHAKLGAADKAIAILKKMKAAGKVDAFDLKDADFDGIRADPRFARLTK